MTGIQAQLLTTGVTTIPVGGAVIFNSVINDLAPGISYNFGNGQFTITQTGNYYVAWWVAADGAATSPEISLALNLNGIPFSIGSSPLVTGQVSGEAFVTVGITPSTINLTNVSSDTVALSSAVPVQASIVILQA